MFTGLIQRVGVVADVSALGGGGVRLVVDYNPPDVGRFLNVGDGVGAGGSRGEGGGRWPGVPLVEESVAVDGCCLTVAEVVEGGRGLGFDVIPQTLAVTTLGGLSVGDRVNLEQCVSPTGLLGGHIVQGHVDGVGEVLEVREGGDWRVRVRLPGGLVRYAVPKGSVTLAGVSLTVAGLDVGGEWIEVALIPTTLERTTLGGLGVGSPINVEMDLIAKTVVHYLENFGGRGVGGVGFEGLGGAGGTGVAGGVA